MNILFIYPKYPETFWSFKHAIKFISKKAAFPPLGILTISSMLPKDFNKKLVDLNVDNLSEKDILWADYIFVSAMLVQKESVKQITELIKKHNRTIVAGGPLFSKENIDEFSYVDHFVLNEGEITLPLFLKDLKNKNLKKIYSSEIKPDIKKSPIPDWNLINMKHYATMLIQYSRGCPFDCEFCDITKLNGRIPRTKSPTQIIRELNILHRSRWRGSVFFVDDNFIGNRNEVKSALIAIGKWMKIKKYPFTLLTEASLNLADDQELMNLMSKANFNTVFLGLETPNKESLENCNKFQNTKRDLAESVKIIQKNGFQVQGGFIVGFDQDTPNIFERQIEFIQKIGVVTAMIGLLNALPGTKLYHRLKKEGRILANDVCGDNTSLNINFIPKMDKEILINGYKKIIQTIYSPKKYYERIMTFVENYRPKYKSRLKIRELGALFKSIWHLGIVDKARKYYWKTITKTLVKKPRALPEVITLLIYGFHFQKVLCYE